MQDKDKQLRINFSAKTYIGKNTPYNTDCSEGFEIQRGYCFVVCSGVNGKEGEGGALASKLAIEGVKRHFKNNPVRNPFSAIQKAMMLANFMVYDYAMKNPRFQSMGVNILVGLLHNDMLFYAASGNISLYLERQMVLYQLINSGEKTDIETLPLFGTEKNARFNMSKNPIQTIESDVIFCAQTSINQYISAEQIAELLIQEDISPELLCYQIVYKLSEIEALETVTVGIARLSDKNDLPPKEISLLPVRVTRDVRKKDRKKTILLAIAGFITIISLLILYDSFLSSPATNEELIVPKVKKEIQKRSAESTPIKDDQATPSQRNISKNNKTTSKEYLTHTVQQGESLYRISLRYNVSVKDLETLNKTEAKNLKSGQKIKVPIQAIHILQQGETLSELSGKYAVPVEDIMKANGIKNKKILKAGQEIIIPNPSKK